MVRFFKIFIISILTNVAIYANLVGNLEGDVTNKNGKLVYSFAFSLPKGAYDIAPQLSLVYSNGAKDSSFGLGFSLSGLETISRCGFNEKIDGYNDGMKFDESSKYCYNGARLVKNGDNTFTLANRNDIKIEAIGDIANPDHWIVWQNNGAIKIYGKSKTSKEKNSKGVVSWYITTIKDRFEHKIEYKYKKSSNIIYLDKINYTPYSIKFNYEKRDDTLNTYYNGKKKTHNKRVKSIEIKNSNKLFATYNFKYKKENISKLASIKWCDKNGECLKPVKFSYKNETNPIDESLNYDTVDIVNENNVLNYYFTDINNDGYTDVCYYEKDSGLKCSINNNSQFSNGIVYTNKIKDELVHSDDEDKDKAINQAIISTLMPFDLNNDGKSDFCVATTKGIMCGINNGSKYNNVKYWTTDISIYNSFRFIDINQDKKIDVCKFDEDGFSCALNSGDSFGSFKTIDKEIGDLALYKELSLANYSDKNKIPQPQLFDINGDGNSDICGFNTDDNSFYCKLGIGYDNNKKQPLFGKWIKWGDNFPFDVNIDKWVDIAKDNVAKKPDCTGYENCLGAPKNTNWINEIINIYSDNVTYQLFDIDGDEERDLCRYNKDSEIFTCKLSMDTENIDNIVLENKEEKIKRFNRTFRFTDLNNDKLPDICYRDNNGYVCRLNTGKGFTKAKTWINLDKKTWPYYYINYKKEVTKYDMLNPENTRYKYEEDLNYDLKWLVNLQEASIDIKDVNGDGLADFRAIIAEKLYVAYNNGNGFGELKELFRLDADVEVITKRKTFYANWLKKLFGLKTEIETNFVNSTYGPLKLAPDLDGIYNNEFCYRSINGISCEKKEINTLALLTKITNSLGKETKIEYGRIKSDNLAISTSNTNAFVVKSISSSDGIGGENKLSFKYGKIIYDGSKALGYDSLQEYNQKQKSKTITTYYREDSALNGQVKEVKNYINNKLISKATNSYQEIKQQEPYLEYARLIKKEEKSYDLEGNNIVTKTTTYSDFNEYNTPQTVIENTTDITGLDYTVTTNTDYLNNKENWLINKPTFIKVTHQIDGSKIVKTTELEYNDKGELIKKVIEPNSNNSLTTTYTINDERTQKTTTITDAKGNSRKSTTIYDTLGRVIKTTNALNQTSTTTYDQNCIHKPKTITDVNGLKLKYEYDSQCRKIKEISPTGVETTISYDWSDGVDRGVDFQDIGFDSLKDVSSYMVTTKTNLGSYKRVYFDTLEREIRSVVKGFSNKDILTDTIYNFAGKVLAKTMPYFKGHFAGDRANYIRFKYDLLNRVTLEQRPNKDGKLVNTEYSYDGLKTIIKTPNNHTKIITKNALGKEIEIVEPNGLKLENSYDAYGNLIKTQIGNRVTTIEYDNLGRKTKLTTPENGTTKYYYNGFGELIKQIDNKGVETTFKYDKLGRLLEKKAGKEYVKYSYDGTNAKGKVAKIESNEWVKEYEYNEKSQLESKSLYIDDEDLTQIYEYDKYGRLQTQITPSGMRKKFYYSDNGELDSVTIPKADLWDYNFINLEKEIEEVAKYIVELKIKVTESEKKIIEWEQKSQEYRSDAEKYLKNIKYEDKKYKALIKASKKYDKTINYYKSKKNNIRKKLDYLQKKLGKVVFKYVKKVGKYYKYKYKACVKKNWKGHCKKYKTITINLPSWLLRDRKYCIFNWKTKKNGRSSKRFLRRFDTYNCRSGVPVNLSLSSVKAVQTKYYNEKINYYQKIRNTKKAEANYHKKKIKYYKDKYNEALKESKYWANKAYSESKEIQRLEQELEAQQKHYDILEMQQEEYLNNDDEQLIWQVTSKTPQNQIEAIAYGNGLMTTSFVNIDGSISRVKVGIAKDLLADIHYSYDDRYNMLSRSYKYKKINSNEYNTLTENFEYDKLDRLTNYSLSNYKSSINRSYDYDIYGNIIAKSDIGFLSYDNHNRLIAITNPLTNKDILDFKYDANGNMLQGYSKSYRFDNFNRAIRAQYSKYAYEEYVYNEAEELVKKSTSQGETTYYLDDYELVLKRDNNNSEHRIMRHKFYADGKEVAVHIKHTIDKFKQVDKTLYFHKDILGSTIAITDNSRTLLSQSFYTPYGEKIDIKPLIDNSIIKSNLPGFTGHKQIGDSSLIFMKARIYDSAIARFISPDTIVPNPSDALSYNRYAYVKNNPLKYTDPNGHFWWFALGAVIYTVGATSDNAIVSAIGRAIGASMMGVGLKGLELSPFEAGAIRGFTTSVLSGGNLEQIFTNTLTSGLGNEFATVIGHGGVNEFGIHDGSPLFGNAFATALAHGITQGAMSALRGQKFKSGFISGIVSKFSEGIFDSQALKDADAFTKASISALIGGIASKAAGSDFVEGAVSAMVVYLWNMSFEDRMASKVAGTSGDVNTKEYKKQNIHSVARENQQFTAIAGAGYSFDAGVSSSYERGKYYSLYFDKDGEYHFKSGWYWAIEGGSGASAVGADSAGFLTFGIFNTGNYKEALRGPYINTGGSGGVLGKFGVDYIQSISNSAVRATTVNFMFGTPSLDGHFRTGYGYCDD